MDSIDCVVVGAGLVGLAIGRAMALLGRETIVLEREKIFGSVTSARNSEVIHAGIYYPQGSLKARACVEGRDRLYAFCADRYVNHRRIGKLIVATTPATVADLGAVHAAAVANGVMDLEQLDAKQANALEPELRCAAALLSPSTGIIDTHGYMQALIGEMEANGGMLVLNAPVTAIRRAPEGWRIWIEGENAPVMACRTVINAAGLSAQGVAASIEGYPADRIPQQSLAKGAYFTYAGKVPFQRLIYPTPEPAGLGTHLTLDLAGQARFGPDVEWVSHVDYSVDPAKCDAFERAVRLFWPEIDPGLLTPGYAGMRPKLSGEGEPAADFVIAGPADHGVEGIVNLFGIESPGLTSSLVLADLAAEKLS